MLSVKLLSMNLIYETLWNRAESGLLISMQGKLFLFDWFNNTDAFDMKNDGPILELKPSFKMLGLTLFSKLD